MKLAVLFSLNAIRGALGKKLENVPITTVDQACETLNSGGFTDVLNKANQEAEKIKDTFFNEKVDNIKE